MMLEEPWAKPQPARMLGASSTAYPFSSAEDIFRAVRKTGFVCRFLD
jgi:hypothetical protein